MSFKVSLTYNLWTSVVLLSVFPGVLCHPQCLDFRAPFQPQVPLTFCAQYSELGCCGHTNDDALREEYDYLQYKATPEDWAQCKGYIKQILCQKCSPYAAHIYDAEVTGKPRQFPGLCRDYCETFYDKCSSLMWFLDSSTAFKNLLASRDRFCESVSLTDVDYCYPDLLGNPMLNNDLREEELGMSSVSAPMAEGCLCLEKIKDKLANPLWARHAGDGSGRLFVAMQKGKVSIYNTNTKQWYDRSFLDITKLSLSRFPGDERGFLGMAFHPDYSNNGRFFVYYATPREPRDEIPPELEGKAGSYTFKIRISEMKVMADNPNKADMSSEKVMLEVLQPFSNHNGGELYFGLDGYLYAFIGDGGAAGDPINAGQDKTLLLGKAIRLDVDSNPDQPYSIPVDNPFVHEAGTRPEIYAYGLRNTWRCGLDLGDRVTGEGRGRVLCGDVGQNAYEEIDLLEKGANYGWNAKEGFECYDEELCGTIVNDTLPVWAYGHKVGKSVTGGVFYRGCESPALNGQYIFGDYVSSRLFSLSQSATDGQWNHRNVSLCGYSGCQGNLVGYLAHSILSFGEDENGEIYVLTSKSSGSRTCDGSVYKVVDPSTRSDPSRCASDLTKDNRVPLPKRTSSGALIEEAGTITKDSRKDSKEKRISRRRQNRLRKKARRRQNRQSRKSKRQRRKKRKGRKGKNKGKKRRKFRKHRKRRRRQRKRKERC